MKVYFGEIYEHVGYLFYAVAVENKKLSKTELEKLKTLVHSLWHEESTVRNANLEDLTEHFFSAIDRAFGDSLAGEEAMDIFEKYFALHHLAYGKPLKEKIESVTNSISREFAIRNSRADLAKHAMSLLEGNSVLS